MVKIDFDLTGVKIPKRVGGVKVPKGLRKQGKRLIEKANSPAGREAIAAGLTIAGAAIAAKARAKAERRAAAAGEAAPAAAAQPAAAGGGRPGEPGIGPGRELGDAIAAGIGAFQRFFSEPRK